MTTKLTQDQIAFLAVILMHNSMRLRYVGPPVFRRHRWHDPRDVIRRIYGGAKLMNKFTPGPWEIRGPSSGRLRGMDDGGDYAIVVNGEIIAEAFRRAGKDSYYPSLHNARLIAAAPDLLKALVAANHALKSYMYGNCAPDLAETITQVASDAILKATEEK